MKVNKQLALGILAHMAAVVRKANFYETLPRPWSRVLSKAWCSLIGSTLFGGIPFGFDAEVSGTRFRLRGPYRYAAGEYYFKCITEGAYEVQVTAHITQVVQQCPAPRVLDVGAHYGWYTIYLAKLIANRGMVFAFEPSGTVFSFLKRNVELNDLHNVRLFQLPLSDKRETVSMVVSSRIPKEPRYMSSVTEGGAKYNYTGTLSAVPFDELNEREAIHPNIVKVDVHGVWRKVIDGMRESLYREVEHLYLEMDSPPREELSSQYTDVQHVILMLRDAGMDVYEIQQPRKRDGGKIIKADENRIVSSQMRGGNRTAMLYAVKRKLPT